MQEGSILQVVYLTDLFFNPEDGYSINKLHGVATQPPL
jgi:hypothetical protein